MTVSRKLLVAILDGIGDCFYAVDSEWHITVFNRGAEQHFKLSRDEVVGRSLWDILPGGQDTEIGREFSAAMHGSSPVLLEAGSLVLQDRVIEGRLFPMPEGGLGVAFQDVTERNRAEIALRVREAELARVQRIAMVGGLEVELKGGFVNRRSPEYLAIHGLPPEAAGESHEDWVSRVHPEDRERVQGQFREALAGDAQRYEAEYRIIRPSDGEVRWVVANAEIERDNDGRAVRLVGAHRDVTQRVVAAQRQRLLINELNHRVKNTLATVQSIASQSFRAAHSTQEASAAFEARLLALSRAHNVLTRENWEGADLQEIVLQAIEPYRDRRADRFSIEGPRLRLRPQTALALAMAVQELTTNALKYGALSNATGRVDIAWSVGSGQPPRLHLRWTETGGPDVAIPLRRGFGSRLIERSLALELNGAVRIAFEPTGVVCTIDASLDTVFPAPSSEVELEGDRT